MGHIVERVALSAVTTDAGVTFRGEPAEFVGGLDRPLPLAVGPDGNLIVGDYAINIIYHMHYTKNQ